MITFEQFLGGLLIVALFIGFICIFIKFGDRNATSYFTDKKTTKNKKK